MRVRLSPRRQCIHSLNAESHDGVDDIVVVLLERLDGLLPRYVGLRHDELNVLVLDALGVHLLAVILLLLGSLVGRGVGALDGLAAGLAVVVARVVVLGLGELLRGGGLGRGVEVLDLGLTEDAVGREPRSASLLRSGGRLGCLHVGVAVGRLVDLGAVDNKQDL